MNTNFTTSKGRNTLLPGSGHQNSNFMSGTSFSNKKKSFDIYMSSVKSSDVFKRSQSKQALKNYGTI